MKNLVKRTINFLVFRLMQELNESLRRELDYTLKKLLPSELESTYPSKKELEIIKKECLINNANNLKQLEGIFADKKSYKILENFLFMRCFTNPLIRYELAQEIAEKTEVNMWVEAFRIFGYPVYRQVDKYQYYPKDIINLGDHEVFLDGGAWVGDTILQFNEMTSGKFDGVFAFEASPTNYKECLNTIARIDDQEKIQAFNCGLGQEGKKLYFPKDTLSGDPVFEPQGPLENYDMINISDIRSILTEEQLNSITFIKLDIEGSELEALKNMNELIANKLPKLAICVYHHEQDIFEIPLYINSLTNQYNMFLRHHENGIYETVLYCVRKDEIAAK